MKTRVAELFYRPEKKKLRHLPEGPLLLDPEAWPVPGNWLAWVAIQHGKKSLEGSLNLLNLDTRKNRTIWLEGRPGFVAETNMPGLLMVGMEREIVLVNCKGPEAMVVHTDMHITTNPYTIINDGISTPFGAVFGSKDTRFLEPVANMYMYCNGDYGIHRIQVNQTCSNGKVVIPDGDQWALFDIDTPTQKVARYQLDVDAKHLEGPETFIDLTGEDLLPDGMRITPDGKSMVIAFFNPTDVPYGVARQYSLADGTVEAEWQTPGSPRVTCPAFIELDGKVKLILTTAVEGMPKEQLEHQENAGGIFIADTDFDEFGPYTPKVSIRHFIDFR